MKNKRVVGQTLQLGARRNLNKIGDVQGTLRPII